MWENPPPEGEMTWDAAKKYCLNLVLDEYADWRLPTLGELRTLIHGCYKTEAEGPCPLEEETCLSSLCYESACLGCAEDKGPSDGCYWPSSLKGECDGFYDYYWTGLLLEDYPESAWVVDFKTGKVLSSNTVHEDLVRCVR